MNCKPGDLAIIVYSLAGNEGKIVRCVRVFGYLTGHDGAGARWVTDPAVPGMLGEPRFPVLDCNLRPIRDQPGEDEMLRIAGKPQDQREPA